MQSLPENYVSLVRLQERREKQNQHQQLQRQEDCHHPSNYVTLAQLQERWKQRNQKDKQHQQQDDKQKQQGEEEGDGDHKQINQANDHCGDLTASADENRNDAVGNKKKKINYSKKMKKQKSVENGGARAQGEEGTSAPEAHSPLIKTHNNLPVKKYEKSRDTRPRFMPTNVEKREEAAGIVKTKFKTHDKNLPMKRRSKRRDAMPGFRPKNVIEKSEEDTEIVNTKFKTHDENLPVKSDERRRDTVPGFMPKPVAEESKDDVEFVKAKFKASDENLPVKSNEKRLDTMPSYMVKNVAEESEEAVEIVETKIGDIVIEEEYESEKQNEIVVDGSSNKNVYRGYNRGVDRKNSHYIGYKRFDNRRNFEHTGYGNGGGWNGRYRRYKNDDYLNGSNGRYSRAPVSRGMVWVKKGDINDGCQGSGDGSSSSSVKELD